MPLTTEFLFGLKKNAPKSLTSSVWQLTVELKINKKRKTRRRTRAGTDTRQKTCHKIPSITSDPLLSQTSKLHLAQNRSTKFKRSNFSNLNTDLVKETNVSGVFLNFCCLNASSVNNKAWQFPILFYPKILIFVQFLKHGLQTTPHQQC